MLGDCLNYFGSIILFITGINLDIFGIKISNERDTWSRAAFKDRYEWLELLWEEGMGRYHPRAKR